MALRANGVAARRAVGSLGDDDRYAGLAEACVSLADQVDADPASPSLWREYLKVLRDVLEAGYDADDALADLLDDFQAQMGD